MTDILIPGMYRNMILDGVNSIDSGLGFLVSELQKALGWNVATPTDIAMLRARLSGLRDVLSRDQTAAPDVRLPAHFGEVLKTVIQHERRRIASQVDGARRNTQHVELLADLESRLSPFRLFAAAEWFPSTATIHIPRQDDYLSAQYLTGKRPIATAESKDYDPKHGVFLSNAQLWIDLRPLRDSCDSRRVPLSVLFIDVDDFKAVNSAYGEPSVDRDLLPTLMRILEGAFFGHGTVYRYGGDEFVAVVPKEALHSVHIVRLSAFAPVHRGPTVRLA